MKVILYMALSANGYIARMDGREDFLSHANWTEFVKLAEKAGCFAVGRRTYEIVKKTYKSGFNYDTVNARRLVVSRGPAPRHSDGYTFVKSPKDAINAAKGWGVGTIILTGGSTINSAFMRQGLIDEVIFDVEPFVLGRGISVLAPEKMDRRLKLLGVRTIKGGIVQLRYKII